MAALVLHCLEADYDPATAVCTSPFYSYNDSAIPHLSIDDAKLIGLEIALLWAVAFAARMCRKALQEIG